MSYQNVKPIIYLYWLPTWVFWQNNSTYSIIWLWSMGCDELPIETGIEDKTFQEEIEIAYYVTQ